jgi:hypothetical protein
MPAPIELSGEGLDLSGRMFARLENNRSPANQTEAIVVTVPILGDLALVAGVIVVASIALRIGTNGTGHRLRVRRTDINGTLVADSTLIAGASAEPVTRCVLGFDAAPPMPGLKYVLTSETPNAVATSVLDFAALCALAV